MGQIIASRAVQGAGGAGMVSVVSIIVTDIMPKKEVATTRSYVNVLQTMGRSCGGVVGGLVTQAVGWRWAFLAQVPPMIVAITLVVWKLDLPRIAKEGETDSRWEKLKKVDFVGSFFLGMTILAICLLLDLGGTQLDWSSKWMIGFCVAGGVSIVAFTISAKLVSNPIYPLELLAQRAVITNYLSILLAIMSQMSLMTFVPIYFQSTAHASTAAAGAYLIPAFAGNTVGGLLTGHLIKKTGRYKLFTALAPLVSICCMTLLLLTWNGNTSIALSLLIFPGGFAAGMVSSSAFVGLIDGISEEHVAVAASGSYLFFNLGAIAGVSAGSASFNLGLRSALNRTLDQFPDKARVRF
jgi:MFS family permease